LECEFNITGVTRYSFFNVTANGVLEGQAISDLSEFLNYTSGAVSSTTDYLIDMLESRYRCVWSSGAANGSIYSQSVNEAGNNLTVNINNSRRFSLLTCELDDLDGDCNYGALNVSSIKFHVNSTSQALCSVLAYTPRSYTGNMTLVISEDERFNRSNLGTINYSIVNYIRHYYFSDSGGIL